MEDGHMKYLGIMIHRHMRWNLQTKQLISKIGGHIPKL